MLPLWCSLRGGVGWNCSACPTESAGEAVAAAPGVLCYGSSSGNTRCHKLDRVREYCSCSVNGSAPLPSMYMAVFLRPLDASYASQRCLRSAVGDIKIHSIYKVCSGLFSAAVPTSSSSPCSFISGTLTCSSSSGVASLL